MLYGLLAKNEKLTNANVRKKVNVRSTMQMPLRKKKKGVVASSPAVMTIVLDGKCLLANAVAKMTMPIAASNEGSLAENSEKPNTFKHKAVSQKCSGGFAQKGTKPSPLLISGISQSPEMTMCCAIEAYRASVGSIRAGKESAQQRNIIMAEKNKISLV